jgi:hypothetical protein
MTIDVVVVIYQTCPSSSSPFGVPLPLLLYQGRRGYKEDNRVGYNMISIRTLSLLACFTYIFIDRIIYVLESKSWSSRIFRMVGRVIANPSLGLPSPCGMVFRVLILVRNKEPTRWKPKHILFTDLERLRNL